MKTSKFLLSTLVAAAAMTSSAYAATVNGITWTDNADTETRTFTGTATGYVCINGTNNDQGLKDIPDGYSVVFSSVGGNGDAAWFTRATMSQNIQLLGTGLIVKGGTTSGDAIFSGSVSGEESASFTINNDTAGNQQTYLFTGDITQYKGSFSRATATTGNLEFGDGGAYSSNLEGVISNISGSGSILTSGALIYNYATSNSYTTLSVDNSSITARNLEFKGGASYSLASDTTVSNSLTIAAGTSLSIAAGKALNLSGTVSLSSAIQNSGTVALGENVQFDVSAFDFGDETTVTLINGTITGVEEGANITLVSAGRTTGKVSGGQIVLTKGAVYTDLVWAGGETGEWNTSSETWTSVEADGTVAFADRDSVEFKSNATITVADAGVKAETVTISEGNVSFSGGVIVASEFVVNGGNLTLNKYDNGSTSALRGALTINDGGMVTLSGGDATGYNGAEGQCIHTITVNAGGTLYINDNANQTFGKMALILNGGTISGEKESDTFDLFNNGASITAKGNVTSKILVGFNLRQDDSVITVEEGGLLIASGTIGNGSQGNHNMIKRGTGTLELSGTNTYTGTTTVNEGTLRISGGAMASAITNNATLEIAGGTITGAITNGREIKFSGESAISTLAAATANGSTITIEEGAKVTVETMTNAWGANFTLKGDAEFTVTGTAVFGSGTAAKTISGSGTMNFGGWNLFNHANYTITGITLNLGASGIVNDNTGLPGDPGTGTQTLGKMVLGATDSWSNNAVTLKLNDKTDGTTINTTKYDTSSGYTDEGVTISIGASVTGEGALKKIGLGDLVLSGTNNYSGGTTISGGTLVAGNALALGTGDVTVSGGQLDVNNVTISNAINIVLADGLYADTAAVIGTGTLSGPVTISADLDALNLVTQTSYMLWGESVTFSNALSYDFDNAEGWTYELAEDGRTLVFTAIPEPSAFGLLAGVGALALVAARRRRRS